MVKDLLYASKRTYYCGKVKNNLHNPKFLFSTINKLLQVNTDHLIPAAPMTVPWQILLLISLLRSFLKYALPFRVPSLIMVLHLLLLLITCTAHLSSFSQVDCIVVHKLLTRLTRKSCSLDLLPACVLKECSDTLLPIFTMIIVCFHMELCRIP